MIAPNDPPNLFAKGLRFQLDFRTRYVQRSDILRIRDAQTFCEKIVFRVLTCAVCGVVASEQRTDRRGGGAVTT
jgi:hypothetical protein